MGGTAGAETQHQEPYEPHPKHHCHEAASGVGEALACPSGCTTLLVGEGSVPLILSLGGEAAEGGGHPALFSGGVNTESRISPEGGKCKYERQVM